MKVLGKKPLSPPIDIHEELRKVRSYIDDLSDKLADSELDIASSVRLSVELRELEAYARGILFAMGQAQPWED
jgi:hypothetical protein